MAVTHCKQQQQQQQTRSSTHLPLCSVMRRTMRRTVCCTVRRIACCTHDVTLTRQARADHLKKQRDLLLAQRKKAREADLANYTPPPPPVAPPAPTAAEIAAAPPSGSMRGKVGCA